ncbi:hypothetical protein ACLB2K_076652 [Fragaria x ananassa]
MRSLQLRRLLLRSLSASSSPTFNQTQIPFLSTNPTHHYPNPITSNFLSLPRFPLTFKPFSSSSSSPTHLLPPSPKPTNRTKKDPFRLQSEAEKILVDMDFHGVPRNVETFNVLITNLCKIRKTDDALSLFHRMGEWGSLYQAARVGEGDEMIDRMKSAGFGKALDKKAYFGFLKILCGIERIDHALYVFKKMKQDGCEPWIKTYDLLMGKLYAHNRADRATALFNEEQKKGVPVTHKPYQVDPKYLKKPKAEKENTRETLPEKMTRKRRRLKQIRPSFVKKPKKGMRRAY